MWESTFLNNFCKLYSPSSSYESNQRSLKLDCWLEFETFRCTLWILYFRAFLVDSKISSFSKTYMHSSETDLEPVVDRTLFKIDLNWLPKNLKKVEKAKGVRTRTPAKYMIEFSVTIANCLKRYFQKELCLRCYKGPSSASAFSTFAIFYNKQLSSDFKLKCRSYNGTLA